MGYRVGSVVYCRPDGVVQEGRVDLGRPGRAGGRGHALLDFPYSDQWEGTYEQLVAMARIPLEALVRLAPIAGRAGAIGELTNVSHPFWELRGRTDEAAIRALGKLSDPLAGAPQMLRPESRSSRREHLRSAWEAGS